MKPSTSAALLCGASIYTAMVFPAAARADGVIDDVEFAYIAAYGEAVCLTLDEYPSEVGVLGVAQAITEDGFTADSAVDIVNASVYELCPEYFPMLQRIGAEARGETTFTGSIGGWR